MPDTECGRDLKFWHKLRGRLAKRGFDPCWKGVDPPAEGESLICLTRDLDTERDEDGIRVQRVDQDEVEEVLHLLGWEVVNGLIYRRNREAVAS